MSRALANHHLYLAQVLLQAWERDTAAQNTPGTILDQAYYPAVREQLLSAYGWFLTAVLDPTVDAKGPPPRGTAQLPRPLPGKALPGEIREFQLLERSGWLAELLAEPSPAALTRGRQPAMSLAVSASLPSAVDARLWHHKLQGFFDRMNDSLDEC